MSTAQPSGATPMGNFGGGSLPTATATGQALVATGPGTIYAAQTRRVAPDASDVLVYACTEAAGTGTVANSGTASSATLTVAGSAVQGSPAIYGAGISFSGGTSDQASGAQATQPAYPITVSLWVNVRALPASYVRLFCRPVNNYASPYMSVTITLNSTGTVTMQVDAGGSAAPGSAVANLVLSPGVDYHLGFTYDGTTFKAYCNGILCASTAVTGAIGYTTNANDVWAIGHNPGSSEASPWGTITDVRVATVARPLSWWANVYLSAMGRLGP